MDARVATASQPPAANVTAALPVIADPKMEPVPAGDKVPKYRLMERAYLADKIHEPGEAIFYKDPPAYFMHPLNAAARNAYRANPPKGNEFMGKLPVAPEAPANT